MPKSMSASRKLGMGKGWRGDKKAHARVGRLGGLATAKSHDIIFYSRIGRLGGRVSGGNFANNPTRAREAGRKGGKARSLRLKKEL